MDLVYKYIICKLYILLKILHSFQEYGEQGHEGQTGKAEAKHPKAKLVCKSSTSEDQQKGPSVAPFHALPPKTTQRIVLSLFVQQLSPIGLVLSPPHLVGKVIQGS